MILTQFALSVSMSLLHSLSAFTLAMALKTGFEGNAADYPQTAHFNGISISSISMMPMAMGICTGNSIL